MSVDDVRLTEQAELLSDLQDIERELLSLAGHCHRKLDQIKALQTWQQVDARRHHQSAEADLTAFATGPLLRRYRDRLTVFNALLKLEE